MNKCKRRVSVENKTQVEFQIINYLVFGLALKEKCPPTGEKRRQYVLATHTDYYRDYQR